MKKPLCNFDGHDEFINHLEKINPNKKAMTIERLKAYPGCEKYSDEKAADILKTLEELAVIALKYTAHENLFPIDNQQVVSLRQTKGATEIPLNIEYKSLAA